MAALLLATLPTGASAQDSGEGLASGPWWAAGSAQGTATASESGLTITWQGRVPAQFEFEVDADGSVGGTWEHQGEADMRFRGMPTGTARGEFEYAGSGGVGGTNQRLELDALSRTTGKITVEAGGHSQTFPVDNQTPTPPLFVNVRSSTCDEAYGDWAYTVEQAFEGEGFTASFDGWWVAVRSTEEFQGYAEQLRRLALETGVGAPGGTGGTWESPLLELAADVIWRYDVFAEAVGNAGRLREMPELLDVLFDVLADAASVANTLRNLSDCDKQLIGEENVEKYLDAMTMIVEQLVDGAVWVTESGIATETWQIAAQAAARTGVIGEGAVDPAAAARIETSLVDAGSEILNQHYDPETDTVAATDDTIRVMATGAAMGWTYEVAGSPFPARGSYELFQGDSE